MEHSRSKYEKVYLRYPSRIKRILIKRNNEAKKRDLHQLNFANNANLFLTARFFANFATFLKQNQQREKLKKNEARELRVT